jgi:hypothetical protein
MRMSGLTIEKVIAWMAPALNEPKFYEANKPAGVFTLKYHCKQCCSKPLPHQPLGRVDMVGTTEQAITAAARIANTAKTHVYVNWNEPRGFMVSYPSLEVALNA